MPNVTISIGEKLLKKSRKYAEKRGTSLNALIRDLLTDKVDQNSEQWIQELFDFADKKSGNSSGKKWKREDLYER